MHFDGFKKIDRRNGGSGGGGRRLTYIAMIPWAIVVLSLAISIKCYRSSLHMGLGGCTGATDRGSVAQVQARGAGGRGVVRACGMGGRGIEGRRRMDGERHAPSSLPTLGHKQTGGLLQHSCPTVQDTAGRCGLAAPARSAWSTSPPPPPPQDNKRRNGRKGAVGRSFAGLYGSGGFPRMEGGDLFLIDGKHRGAGGRRGPDSVRHPTKTRQRSSKGCWAGPAHLPPGA